MKKLIFLFILIAFGGVQISAQVETRIYPERNALKDLPFNLKEGNKSKLIDIPKPKINLQKEEEDSLDLVPFQVGIPIDVSYSLLDGNWEKYSDGRLWSMTVESKGAQSMAFIFSSLYLPEGAQLYILNQDKTMLYGPVTHKSIFDNKEFMTNIIDGSNLTIYLYEPDSEKGKSKLELSRILYGLVGNDVLYSNQKSTYTDCHLDVACVPGWDIEADATGYIVTGTGTGGSGALLMTTDNSFKGYFLTAKHVTDTSNSIMSVSFFRRKKNCGNNTEYSVETCHNIYKRASWSNTDMSLVEVIDLPDSEKLAWLGWDRTGNSSNGGAFIHYPGAAVPAEIALEYGSFSNYDSYYWEISLDAGFSDNGSSGAALLDANRRVVGQLRGNLYSGPVQCENYYKILGKFSKSWSGGGTNSTRLSNWLDPTGTNLTITNTRRRHNPVLSGPTTICYGSTGTFTVSDLPPNAVVQWSLYDGTGPYTPTLQTSGGTCNITNNYAKSYMGMLRASVILDGYLLKSMVKMITLYSGFYGVYNHGSATNQQITIGNPIWVTKGQQLSILSPNLVGKDVTHSVTAPSAWQYVGSIGKLNLTYPNTSTNNPIIISIQNNTYSPTCDNSYQLIVLPNTLISSYKMNIGARNGKMEVVLTPIVSEEHEEKTTVQVDSEKVAPLTWTLEVFSATTGEKVFSQTVEGSSFTIDTTSWKPGVYVVRAVIGDEVLNEKVVVN